MTQQTLTNLLLAIAMAVTLAGCTESTGTDVQPEAEPGAPAPSPPSELEISFGEPVVVASQVPRYGIADEPTVAAAPDGTIYVSAKFGLLHDYFDQNPGNARVWRSDDGVSFELLNDPTGRLTDGKQGNQDTDLYVDDQGTVHLVDLVTTPGPAFGRHTVPYIVSTDRGDSWRQAQDFGIADTDADRQWIAGDKDVVVVTWRAGQAVGFALSHDKGITWDVSSLEVDHYKLGNVAVQGNNVAFGVFRGDDLVVVRSEDLGSTWLEEFIALPVDQATVMFPAVAIAESGSMFAAASIGPSQAGEPAEANIFLAIRPANETWGKLAQHTNHSFAIMPSMTTPPGGRVALGYLATDDPGSIAMDSHAWHVYVDVGTQNGNLTSWQKARVSKEPAHDLGICTAGRSCAGYGGVPSDRRMGEIFEVGHTATGGILVTWPDTAHGAEGLTAIMFAQGTVENL